MTLHALGPYYFQLNYHSADAPHSHLIGCNEWNPASSGGSAGSVLAWDTSYKDADDMAEQLVDTLLPFYNSDTVYDNFIVWHKPLDPGPANPVAGGSFTGMVGTGTGGSWARAVQKTMVFRTAAFHQAKLVLLDAQSANTFDPVFVADGTISAVLAELSADDNGWCGRDDSQITSFVKVTTTLNEALRKAYRMD